MTRREKKMSLLSEVAIMYYQKNLTQSQIAEKLFISRTSISRLLQEARDEGVVEIKINFPSERCSQIEDIFKKKFGLEEVFIFNIVAGGQDEIRDFLCRNAARFVNSQLQPGMTFGVTRGRIVAGVMRHLTENHPRRLDLRLVQLMGETAEADPNTSSGDLIRKMLNTYGGTAYYLNAPLHVDNDNIRDALMREPIIKKTLRFGGEADFAITGIGAIDRGIGLMSSIMVDIADPRTIEELVTLGGVGNIFGRVFDIKGGLVPHPLNNRIIGVGFKELRKIRTVAVSYGSERGGAVLGAIRSRHVNILFIDRDCAQQVLERAG